MMFNISYSLANKYFLTNNNLLYLSSNLILYNDFPFKEAIKKLSIQYFENLSGTFIISEIPIEGTKENTGS